MTLSYFICEQHSENFEQIIHLAEKLGFSVRVYESKDSNQFDFLQAVYRDTATIVDATNPDDLTLSTVYPLLTAHVNILDHILVFSDKHYEDGAEVLPLNITPKRTRNRNEDLLEWLEKQLLELKEESLFDRFVIESPDVVVNYMKRMEEAIVKSLDKYEQKRGGKTRVMLSYRNSCSEEVELFRKEEEAKGKVEIKVLPPGSLCGDYEAHTPMRRWMLAGLLDDHIREVDEVWVYYNDTYTNSWWTLAELVMVANINKDRSDDKKVKIKVYDAKEKRFLEEKDYPLFVDVKLTDNQHRRLARLLSNTRPDTMGPENLDNMVQLRQVVPILRVMTDEMREAFIENIRPMLEMGIPQTLPDDQRELMLQDMLKLYSNPDELERYVNDEVFQEVFWKNISYQTDVQTPAMKNGVVDPDEFMDAPMSEATHLSEEDLKAAVNRTIQLQSASGAKLYHVEKGITRYLWLATRMGMPTVKDAPGIEVVQTYNLITIALRDIPDCQLCSNPNVDESLNVKVDKKNYKEYHINNSTIRIIFGNILDSQAEVIVSSDDCNISMGGGVSMAIRQKEGTDTIRFDVKKKVPADIGDVVVSTAGTLPQKNIFHVITIGYNGLNHANLSEGISKDDVHKYIIGHSIDKCFLLLHAMDMTSIAFPQIGAGVAGIPFKKVAEMMAEAIGRNLRKTNKALNVEIYLYDRFEKMNQWDFLPMFEQFSAQEAIAKMLSEQANDRLFADDASGQSSAGDIPTMDKDIFISYSRKDVEIVKAIYEWLERAGYKCWLDVNGMFSGVSYKKVIVDAIKRSKVLLFMSSENSNKSRNVVSEVSIAVEYGKKIIPVRLDMTSYSESIEYDIINHDYVVYDRSRVEDSNREMLKKIVSTLEMV